MNLNIVSVKDAGAIEDERLILKAKSNIDIGEYLVADTTYQGEGQVSNKLRHIFWLPDRDVSSRDLVVIYTKAGKDKSKENKSGNRTHFIYWGLDRPVWNIDGDAATIFHIDDWSLKQV